MTSLEAFYQVMPELAADETLADIETMSKSIGDGEVFLTWFEELLGKLEDVHE